MYAAGSPNWMVEGNKLYNPKRDSWFQYQRLLWIDCHLSLYGTVSPKQIKLYFGTSRASAASDIGMYRALGGRIVRRNTFYATKDGFEPLYKGHKSKWRAFQALEPA